MKNYPKNVALIMDGNGRWATKHHKKRSEGHAAGLLNMFKLCKYAFELGAESIVCYGLSLENLKREESEVSGIYKVALDGFNLFVRTFTQQQVAVKFIGDFQRLPESMQELIKNTEAALESFKDNGKTIYIAIGYSSRNEIVRKINECVEKGITVDEKSFLNILDYNIETDLLIRTGKEQRISNFLLYQISYSELYFSKKLFPDFKERDLKKAFENYAKRNRRFGLVK